MGRHHFWLLPNLTEDCGFLESFKPFYSHSVAGDKKDKDGGRHKKDDDDAVPKDSADEDDNGDGKQGCFPSLAHVTNFVEFIAKLQ